MSLAQLCFENEFLIESEIITLNNIINPLVFDKLTFK